MIQSSEQPRTQKEFDRIQQQLDDALADTFPASDPISFVTSQAEEAWILEVGEPESENRADQGARDLSGVKKPAT